MKFLTNLFVRSSQATSHKSSPSLPLIEPCEARQMMSATPLINEPLVPQTAGQFQVSAPASWTVKHGSDGILMTSRDGSEEVGLLATVANGAFTASQIVKAEVNAGGEVLAGKVLANGLVSKHEFKQAGIALVEFQKNGTDYVTGEVVETLNFATGPKSVKTVTLLAEMTAPKANFAADAHTMVDMLKSVHQHGFAKPHSAPVHSNTSVPGLSGSWSNNPAMIAVERQYTAQIEAETLFSEESIDASCDSFCDYLTS